MIALGTQAALRAGSAAGPLAQVLLRGRAGPWVSALGEAITGWEGGGCTLPGAC